VVLGVLRLARTARVRWEPVSLLAGALITAAGFAIPAVGWAFLLGLLVLIGTLLRSRPFPCGRYRAGTEPARCSMAWAYSRPAR
jgi:hypothetical protein